MALDCEMVQTTKGQILAHVSIVDSEGKSLYNTYVKPPRGAHITNLLTQYSGITSIRQLTHHSNPTFHEVQEQVKEILKDKIVVGHALINDFKALRLNKADYEIRNTAETPFFMQFNKVTGRLQPRKLQALAHEFLGRKIQDGTHDATEDALAALNLYKGYADRWNEPFPAGFREPILNRPSTPVPNANRNFPKTLSNKLSTLPSRRRTLRKNKSRK